eukprot:gene27113-41934_t
MLFAVSLAPFKPGNENALFDWQVKVDLGLSLWWGIVSALIADVAAVMVMWSFSYCGPRRPVEKTVVTTVLRNDDDFEDVPGAKGGNQELEKSEAKQPGPPGISPMCGYSLFFALSATSCILIYNTAGQAEQYMSCYGFAALFHLVLVEPLRCILWHIGGFLKGPAIEDGLPSPPGRGKLQPPALPMREQRDPDLSPQWNTQNTINTHESPQRHWDPRYSSPSPQRSYQRGRIDRLPTTRR